MMLLVLTIEAGAQEYNTALGGRISPFWGITAKHFYNNSDAIEGILHSRLRAFKVTGLWERHMPAFDEPGLEFYYGGGAHIGAATSRYYHDRFYYGSRVILGIDGILGIQYTVQEDDIPLNASLDWKPAFDLTPFAGFWPGEIGLSVRYIFR